MSANGKYAHSGGCYSSDSLYIDDETVNGVLRQTHVYGDAKNFVLNHGIVWSRRGENLRSTQRDEFLRQLYYAEGDPIQFAIILHYGRNVLNEAPITEKAAIDSGWTKLKPSESVYHQIGYGNENNAKYVSPNGKMEAVYNLRGNLVNDLANVGTYNYSPPSDAIGHMLNDVIPYYLLGNSPDDITSGSDKIWVTLRAIILKTQGK